MSKILLTKVLIMIKMLEKIFQNRLSKKFNKSLTKLYKKLKHLFWPRQYKKLRNAKLTKFVYLMKKIYLK